MDEENMDSDSSDLDYVPDGSNVELPSEEESDGEVLEDDSEHTDPANTTRKKRGQKTTKRKSKKLKQTEPENPIADQTNLVEKPLNEEEQKKKSDSLWADFLKDTDFKVKPKPIEIKKNENNVSTPKKAVEPIKKTVTEIFKFAGEEVKVSKEIPVDKRETHTSAGTTSRGRGRSGISSVLNQIGKKEKISTLEKSKLDWNQFKKEEDIEEELQAHNKGKHGYLERQDFLQRADLRQFEIEKEMRTTHRSNRL